MKYHHLEGKYKFNFWPHFWAGIGGMDAAIILFCLLMYFNNYSVFNWMLNARYSVWCFTIGSGIVGVSFAYSTRNSIKKLHKIKIPPGVSWGRILNTRVAALHSPVKGVKRG